MSSQKFKKNQNPPLTPSISLVDIIDIQELQNLQEVFSGVHGVSSVITNPEGIPITQPSNFTYLCEKVIRKTEIGLKNCFKSDAVIGNQKLEGPTVQPCLSCGLWDAGASITVGGIHIGNWLIGQVRNQKVDEKRLISYAKEIGVSEQKFMEAYFKVPEMSVEQFQKVADLLFVFANQLSEKAYSNLLLKQQIEENKRVQIQKIESEKKYQNMYNNALVALFRVNVHSGKAIEANHIAAEIFGYNSREEFLREYVSSNHYYNPDDRIELLQKLNRKKRIDKITMHAKKKDGTEAWHEAFFYFNKEEGFLDCVASDVTQRVQAEQMFEESEAKFSKAFFDHETPLIIVDLHHSKLVNYNKSFIKLFGLESKSKEEIKKFGEIHIKEFIDENATIIVNQDHLSNFRINYKKSDENILELILFASLIENKKQNLAIVTIYDDTQNAKNIKELRQNNLRLEALLKILQNNSSSIKDLLNYTLEQAIQITESKIGYLYYYSEEKKQFTLNTWSGEVMQECSVVDPQTLCDLDSTGCWGEAVRQRKPFLLNNYSEKNKYKKGTPDGHVALKKFLTIPVIIDNEIKAVIGVANKETDYVEKDTKQLQLLMDAVWKEVEKQQFQNQLLEAKVKAEESDRLKSAFLSNMSHEIRTPMNGILGFIELLEDPSLSLEDQKHFFGIVRKSSKRLLNTINDIIEISKIESGQTSVYNRLESLSEILNYQLSFFRAEAESRGIELLFLNEPPALKIYTDRSKLDSILSGLINNALKFTSKGSVSIGCSVYNDKIQFQVKDTGIGILKERQQHIFNRFEQGDIGINRGYEGSGLGLTIAKAYAEMLGGEIWLESEKGKGSTFYFTINFNQLFAEEKMEMKQEVENRDEEILVLVAEDDPTSFTLLTVILGGSNLKLIKAEDGKKAVQLFKENPDIKLILMDLKMPEMDGIEATKEIRKINANIPIIAQTAYALAGDKEKALEAGCNSYITKPLNRENLLATINEYLNY